MTGLTVGARVTARWGRRTRPGVVVANTCSTRGCGCVQVRFDDAKGQERFGMNVQPDQLTAAAP